MPYIVQIDGDDPQNHAFRLFIVDEAGEEIDSGDAEFAWTGIADPGAVAYLPGFAPLAEMMLPKAGDYEVSLTIDGLVMARLPLRAAEV